MPKRRFTRIKIARVLNDKKFQSSDYHTKEKPFFEVLLLLVLWLLSTLQTPFNWQMALLVAWAVILSARHWSWSLALITLGFNLGMHHEIVWIKYPSMALFFMVIWLTFLFSLYAPSGISFAREPKEPQEVDDRGGLWRE
jgi:hypothetical protein